MMTYKTDYSMRYSHCYSSLVTVITVFIVASTGLLKLRKQTSQPKLNVSLEQKQQQALTLFYVPIQDVKKITCFRFAFHSLVTFSWRANKQLSMNSLKWIDLLIIGHVEQHLCDSSNTYITLVPCVSDDHEGSVTLTNVKLFPFSRKLSPQKLQNHSEKEKKNLRNIRESECLY